MKRDQLAARLAKIGEQRAAAIEARAATTEALSKVIPLAYEAGIGVTEITRLTGLSRRSVYDVIDRAADK